MTSITPNYRRDIIEFTFARLREASPEVLDTLTRLREDLALDRPERTPEPTAPEDEGLSEAERFLANWDAADAFRAESPDEDARARGFDMVARYLAAIFCSHPDYDESWRP